MQIQVQLLLLLTKYYTKSLFFSKIDTQYVEKNLNKIAKTLNKIFEGLNCMLRRLRKCVAHNPIFKGMDSTS